jgi:oleandomycin transport system permease protein
MTTTSVAGQTTQAQRQGEPPKRPYGLVRHSLALARRSVIKTWRTPEGLAHAIVIPIIFLTMFVYLFGGAVAGSTRDYLQFVFPGAMLMTVIISGTMITGVNLNADIKKGVFERFRSLPIGRSAPLIGSVLGDVIRYVVSLAGLFAFGYAIGFRVHTNLLAALAACALTILFAFCLSWGYVFVGVLFKEPGGVQGANTLTMFPLAFGTNLVAPTSTMPGWLQAWVKINPVTQVIDACRGLLIGGPVAGPVVRTLVWSVVLVAVFAPLAVWAYRRRT